MDILIIIHKIANSVIINVKIVRIYQKIAYLVLIIIEILIMTANASQDSTIMGQKIVNLVYIPVKTVQI